MAIPTEDGAVAATLIAAVGRALRPAVLILHGRDGIRPAGVYRRYADELAAAGLDAWLFSYYSPADEQVMLNPGREAHLSLYRDRLRVWARKVGQVAGFVATRPHASGRVGLLGLSNGGFLAVGAAAIEPQINAVVVVYGGIPGPMRAEIIRLPPLLALHGEADRVIPVDEGRALVDRAKALGGEAELVVYPAAEHGFDFDPDRASANDAHARAVKFLAERLGARD